MVMVTPSPAVRTVEPRSALGRGGTGPKVGRKTVEKGKAVTAPSQGRAREEQQREARLSEEAWEAGLASPPKTSVATA